jgi:hypothetical protein
MGIFSFSSFVLGAVFGMRFSRTIPQAFGEPHRFLVLAGNRHGLPPFFAQRNFKVFALDKRVEFDMQVRLLYARNSGGMGFWCVMTGRSSILLKKKSENKVTA